MCNTKLGPPYLFINHIRYLHVLSMYGMSSNLSLPHSFVHLCAQWEQLYIIMNLDCVSVTFSQTGPKWTDLHQHMPFAFSEVLGKPTNY
jgi:hypothetical protein